MVLITPHIVAQTAVRVKIEDVTNDTGRSLVLSVGKRNYFLSPNSEFNADRAVLLAPIADELGKQLPEFRNQEPIIIKQMDPVTKQFTDIYRLTVQAFIRNIGQEKALQVSAQLQPVDVNRALLEWTELLKTDKRTTLEIELKFEERNGIVVHAGDTLDIEVDQED